MEDRHGNLRPGATSLKTHGPEFASECGLYDGTSYSIANLAHAVKTGGQPLKKRFVFEYQQSRELSHNPVGRNMRGEIDKTARFCS